MSGELHYSSETKNSFFSSSNRDRPTCVQIEPGLAKRRREHTLGVPVFPPLPFSLFRSSCNNGRKLFFFARSVVAKRTQQSLFFPFPSLTRRCHSRIMCRELVRPSLAYLLVCVRARKIDCCSLYASSFLCFFPLPVCIIRPRSIAPPTALAREGSPKCVLFFLFYFSRVTFP